MTRRPSVGLLLRQLTAHEGWVVRRSTAEASARFLTGAGRWLPASARMAAWLHPRSADAHEQLARRAERRGDAQAASQHAATAERLRRNTLELSPLGALTHAFALRRVEQAGDAQADAVQSALGAGSAEDARRLADRADLPLQARVDALLAAARQALDAHARNARDSSSLERADGLLTPALELECGRADLWMARAALATARSDGAAAREALERAADLAPWDADARAALGEALRDAEPERAAEHHARSLALAGGDRAQLARGLRALESLEPRPAAAARVSLALPTAAIALEQGAESRIALSVELDGGAGALHVLEPYGGGVSAGIEGADGETTPYEGGFRLPLEAGRRTLELRVRADRPDAANGRRPWRLTLALCGAEEIATADVEISVADRRPGRVHYVVTEDHELFDERESTGGDDARMTLVEKSRLAERIANERGARWTHMVDVGSLALVEWAARHSPDGAWPAVAEACREHLVDAVAGGNGLGLHVHAFHDPDARASCHALDAATDRVTTSHDFLELPMHRRGFWSRAFPALGDVDRPETRAAETWRGIGRLEALGRLGDPRFRVAIFRAGSFDFGGAAEERARSLDLVARLGIPCDSNVPKPRFYHRVPERVAYPVSSDVRVPEPRPERARALELCAEFNIEADFLSDVHVLNRYVDRRIESLRQPDGSLRPGVHFVCAMTHDKFINWRMNRDWHSLDPSYGDWATIGGHLSHVAASHPEIHFSTAQQAVLDWYDEYTPALLAWRDEEVIELATPGAASERYRYAIRLLGRGIEVSPARRRRVRTPLPAWLEGRVRVAGIERDGAPWPARRTACGPPQLEWEVDDRDARWELVVEAEPGDGIRAEPLPARPQALRLRSRHRYRRASVAVPAALAPDGRARRVRGVAFAAADDGFEAVLDLDAPSADESDGGDER